MSGFNPKWIIGKTVVSVDMRPFDKGDEFPDHQKAYDPLIYFSDGSYITFTTDETGTGEYGLHINYHKANRNRPHRKLLGALRPLTRAVLA